jgi:hypothetical protein
MKKERKGKKEDSILLKKKVKSHVSSDKFKKIDEDLNGFKHPRW